MRVVGETSGPEREALPREVEVGLARAEAVEQRRIAGAVTVQCAAPLHRGLPDRQGCAGRAWEHGVGGEVVVRRSVLEVDEDPDVPHQRTEAVPQEVEARRVRGEGEPDHCEAEPRCGEGGRLMVGCLPVPALLLLLARLRSVSLRSGSYSPCSCVSRRLWSMA